MILDEPHRGGFFVPEMLGLSGKEQMEWGIQGRAVPPPMHHLTGTLPTAIGDGTSEFTMPATGWLASHSGVIPGGFLAVLADGPLGCSIQSTLPAGTIYTTSELSMSYLRPAYPDGGLLTARGRVIHTGRSLALSEAVVTDAEGREVAHATSRCFIFPPLDSPPPPPVTEHERQAYDTPDPYQRPVQGWIAGAELDDLSGYEVWRRCAAGEVEPPPLAYLTGAKPVSVEEGAMTWTMPASPWLCSPTGFVEGGFLVYLADSAVTTASHTLVPAGVACAAIDVTVKFIRPVPPDGRLLTAVGRVVNHGKSLSVATAEIHNADGKLVATALGSSMLLPGRSLSRVVVEDA
ncbi:MAG TPA: PaaI family thioesterase [Frankiaceae bacterium]|nr:PaaI family thioesterase [Frankiaceae bacterium]